jgi:hypothetical protein
MNGKHSNHQNLPLLLICDLQLKLQHTQNIILWYVIYKNLFWVLTNFRS